MNARLACCAAVFVLMALSNAVVPVLDTFAEGATLQGLIFSGYFFGAMLTVLPAGLASERYGRLRLMRLGIAGTCAAGLAIALLPSAPVVAVARVAEGVATGLFVSASLAFVNSQQDDGRLSGLYMASLNAGLLVGLIATGALVQVSGVQTAGVIVFTVLAVASFALVRGKDADTGARTIDPVPRLVPVLRRYRWLFYATVVIFGAGGAVTGLYPGFSLADPGLLGVQIALQNIATIVAILIVSRLPADPIRTIRASALAMAAAVADLVLLPSRLCRDRGRGGRGPDQPARISGPDRRTAGGRGRGLHHGLVRGDGRAAGRCRRRGAIVRVRGSLRAGDPRLDQRRHDNRAVHPL